MRWNQVVSDYLIHRKRNCYNKFYHIGFFMLITFENNEWEAFLQPYILRYHYGKQFLECTAAAFLLSIKIIDEIMLLGKSVSAMVSFKTLSVTSKLTYFKKILWRLSFVFFSWLVQVCGSFSIKARLTMMELMRTIL